MDIDKMSLILVGTSFLVTGGPLALGAVSPLTNNNLDDLL